MDSQSAHLGSGEDNITNFRRIPLNLQRSNERREIDEQTPVNDIVNFYREIAAEHREQLNATTRIRRENVVLDNNCTYSIPMLTYNHMVFPGQTLEMTPHIFHAEQLFEIANDTGIFGILCINQLTRETLPYGVTCEIVLHEAFSEFQIKLTIRGIQRFKVKDTIPKERTYFDCWFGSVTILPELLLVDPLKSIKLNSTGKSLKTHVARANAIQTPWPLFVYQMYDADAIIQRLYKLFKYFNNAPLPSNVVNLSFWVAQQLRLDSTRKQQFLETNSALHRLQIALRYLNQKEDIKCKMCGKLLAKAADAFVMRNNDPYPIAPGEFLRLCDPYTVLEADGACVWGTPATEYSRFEGYIWSVAFCKSCRQHVGWYFKALKDDLKPNSFWGFSKKKINYMGSLNMDFEDVI